VGYLTGDYQAAVAAQQAALGIYLGLGDELGQADALLYLGAVRYQLGDADPATEVLEAALEIYRDIGDPGGEAEALNELGTLQRIRGSLGQAGASHQAALRLARTIDSTWDEAHALAGLGRCAQAAHRVTDARAYLRQAHAIFCTADADEAARITAELDALTKAVGAHAPEGTTIDVPRECQGPAGQ
jgi:tetratricopeptide (TPR) repeat protein